MFLPELFSSDRKSPFLTQYELARLYENVLRPAAECVLDHQAAEWPATYQDEMFRARTRNGQLAFQTKIIPREMGDIWAERVVDFLKYSTNGWGNGVLFLHQLRGVKHSSTHSPDASTVQDKFNQFLQANHFNFAAELNPDQARWWIDVGIEIASSAQRCLAWRTDSHPAMVKNVCDLPDNVANRITRPGSSKYTRDMLAHLPGVSGCRICPGVRGQGQHLVKYLQFYMTDKSIIYHPEKGYFGKYITCTDIIRGKDMAFIDQLYSLYTNAIGSCYSLARLELRVPFSSASNVLINLDENLLRQSLFSFEPEVIWSVFSALLFSYNSLALRHLRALRALAIKFVLEWQAGAAPSLRVEPRAIVLTAGCCWLLNGLHSTPDKGASSKALMDRILPHITRLGADPDILAHGSPAGDNDVISDEEEDDQRSNRRSSDGTAPAYPYGLIFLRHIRIGQHPPIPHLGKETLQLPENAFLFFFRSNLQDIFLDITSKGLAKPSNISRNRNKSKRTTLYTNSGQNGPENDFDIEARGIQTARPVRHEDESGGENDDGDPPSESMDVRLTRIWRQFLLDVTEKAPNYKAGPDPSYCKLSQTERKLVNEDTYKNTVLSDYFFDCQWKVVGEEDWQTNFNKLFPGIGHNLVGRIQNYKSTRYYPAWIELRRTEPPDVFNACREEINKLFNQLSWMPFAQSDRIWLSRYKREFTRPPPHNHQRPSPVIYVQFAPRWNA